MMNRLSRLSPEQRAAISESSPESAKPALTAQDKQDREDFLYLLSVMETQGASGITQSTDYVDAIAYKDRLKSFLEKEAPEGSVTQLFNDIIFDFDGVLYDSTYAVYKTLGLMIERKGDKQIPSPKTIHEIARSYQAPFQTFYTRFGITLETPEEIATFKKTFTEVMLQIDKKHHAPSTLYPEVKQVLDAIRQARSDQTHLKIHIISAAPPAFIHAALEMHGITGDFDEIHTDCHDKTAMITSIRDHADRKNSTVMIGDLPSDIKDAQRAGVNTIAVARRSGEQERLGMYLPDYIVTDLRGLLNLTSYCKELRLKIYDKQGEKA